MEAGAEKRRRVEEPEPEPKKIFAAGDAVTSRANYMVEWADLHELVRAITMQGQWLLMTGPWQSGKSSLMFALAQASMRTGSGYFSIVTTIGADTISSTNEAPTDSAALTTFFDAVCEDLALNSRGKLKAPPPGAGLSGFRAMLVLPDRDLKLLWFIDEASELVTIRRSVLDAFLKEMRLCKQQSVSRQAAGVFCLRSFVLVGTPVLSQLVEDCRIRRMGESRAAGETYVNSSLPYDVLGGCTSSLSSEASRKADFLSAKDVQSMLEEYSGDYGIRFTSVWKVSRDIIALTGGHKGMVGSCCELIHRRAIFKLEDWKRTVRLGHLSRYLFYSKVYGRALDNMAVYPERAKQVIVECIHSDSGSTLATDADALMLLPAVNDGILLLDNERAELSSGLLLSALLEDCLLTPLEALPEVDSFASAVEVAISYMKPDRFLRDEVLNANGQPSEYIMQSEFLLGMKLVLEHGYRECKYTILVEAKKREKNGQRRCRLDFFLKSAGVPPKGFEVQCLGSGKSIEDHLRRSDRYRALHGCEMHYIYFVVGAAACGADAAAKIKAAIQAESAKNPLIHCWFVEFLPETSSWNMEQLLEAGDWKTCTRKSPASFPKFMLQSRRPVLP